MFERKVTAEHCSRFSGSSEGNWGAFNGKQQATRCCCCFHCLGLSSATRTHLDDHPLHFTRNSNFPWKRSGRKRGQTLENSRRDGRTQPSRGFPVLTFRSRLFRIHSASKTCSPTALSSSMSACLRLPDMRRSLYGKSSCVKRESRASSRGAGCAMIRLQNKTSSGLGLY